MNINTTIEQIQAEFDRLKNIIEEQKLELAQLKSEGLSKIDAAWRTPSPDRDPNKELLNSMIQARANELQVSEGIMWGLVVDMVKRDGMNLEVDEMPEPIDPLADLDPFTCKLKEGDVCEVVDVWVSDIKEGKEKGMNIVIVNQVEKFNNDYIDMSGHSWYRTQLKLISRP